MEMDKIHINAQGGKELARTIASNGRTAKGSHPINLGSRVWLCRIIRVFQRDIEGHTHGFALD